MIQTIRSKALRQFAETGDGSKLPVQNSDKVSRIIAALNAASTPDDLDIPGFFYHGLKGKPKRYSVRVTGNWRITFGWKGLDAIDVDIEDYH